MKKIICIEFNAQDEHDTAEAIETAQAYRNNGFDKIILKPSSNLILDKCLNLLTFNKPKITYLYGGLFEMIQ